MLICHRKLGTGRSAQIYRWTIGGEGVKCNEVLVYKGNKSLSGHLLDQDVIRLNLRVMMSNAQISVAAHELWLRRESIQT